MEQDEQMKNCGHIEKCSMIGMMKVSRKQNVSVNFTYIINSIHCPRYCQTFLLHTIP